MCLKWEGQMGYSVVQYLYSLNGVSTGIYTHCVWTLCVPLVGRSDITDWVK